MKNFPQQLLFENIRTSVTSTATLLTSCFVQSNLVVVSLSRDVTVLLTVSHIPLWWCSRVYLLTKTCWFFRSTMSNMEISEKYLYDMTHCYEVVHYLLFSFYFVYEVYLSCLFSMHKWHLLLNFITSFSYCIPSHEIRRNTGIIWVYIHFQFDDDIDLRRLLELLVQSFALQQQSMQPKKVIA